MRMLNATNDYTEKDEAQRSWIMLQENRFRQDCIKEAKKTAKMAIKDVAFLAACATFIILVIVVVANIWL